MRKRPRRSSRQYESIPFADAHRAVLDLIPAMPGRVLDIGSGTGRDAAWFAGRGHSVVAVEPTDAMRLPAMALHPVATDRLAQRQPAGSRGSARPRRHFRPRDADSGLDASRRTTAPAGDAEPRRAAAAGRHHHHENPAPGRCRRDGGCSRSAQRRRSSWRGAAGCIRF